MITLAIVVAALSLVGLLASYFVDQIGDGIVLHKEATATVLQTVVGGAALTGLAMALGEGMDGLAAMSIPSIVLQRAAAIADFDRWLRGELPGPCPDASHYDANGERIANPPTRTGPIVPADQFKRLRRTYLRICRANVNRPAISGLWTYLGRWYGTDGHRIIVTEGAPTGAWHFPAEDLIKGGEVAIQLATDPKDTVHGWFEVFGIGEDTIGDMPVEGLRQLKRAMKGIRQPADAWTGRTPVVATLDGVAWFAYGRKDGDGWGDLERLVRLPAVSLPDGSCYNAFYLRDAGSGTVTGHAGDVLSAIRVGPHNVVMPMRAAETLDGIRSSIRGLEKGLAKQLRDRRDPLHASYDGGDF